jgi:16S rRNA (guanine966-N2)-methyltransferase
MRIVGGAHRGRRLVAPKGHSTRPTADRTREALFNVLEHAPWSEGLAGRVVIDLFAGSGALGLEALSRGAATCLFVDRDAMARAAIAESLSTLKLATQARVDRRDGARLGARSAADGPAADLAFLDPPYGQGLLERALAALAAGDWLAPGAIVVGESGAAEPAPAVGGYAVLDVRTWGAAKVSFLRAAGDGGGPE